MDFIGLSASIPALQDVGLYVQMTNPLVAGTSGTFDIAILRGGTNVIYDERSDISGVTITPSRMSSVSLAPIDTTRIQGKNKIMTYVLRFKPKNALPTGAAIQISLPAGFQLDSTSPYSHYILYGLSDLSESSPVGMALDYTNNLITITNFASMASPDEIGVRLRLQNPSASGTTNIGSITTYVDSTLAVAIDKSQRSMYTTIASSGEFFIENIVIIILFRCSYKLFHHHSKPYCWYHSHRGRVLVPTYRYRPCWRHPQSHFTH